MGATYGERAVARQRDELEELAGTNDSFEAVAEAVDEAANLTGGDAARAGLIAEDIGRGQLPGAALGPPGHHGPEGHNGSIGQLRNARGYAHVLADGTLDTANSQNVNRALKFSTGWYCVNFTFTPSNYVAVIHAASGSGEIKAWCGGWFGPGGSYNSQVQTSDMAGTLADRDFWVMAN
jgi:hypothetical protein